MAGTVGGGAMAGGLAAASLEFVDRTFEQFADGEQRFDEQAVLFLEFAEELALAAGTLGCQRHGSICMLYTTKT